MLAVVSGCMRFHHYLYGREFICQSDHKPLEDTPVAGCKGYCLRYNHKILSLSMFQVRTSQWQMHSAVSLRRQIKGLDVTIYELIPQLSRIRVESVQKATQQDKDTSSTYSTDVGQLAWILQETTRDPETTLAMEGWPIHWTLMHHLEKVSSSYLLHYGVVA